MRQLPLMIVPDEDEADVAEVFVEGHIADKPYRFLLDTGAARTSVIWDEYTAQFEEGDTHHSSGVFARHSNHIITLPSITVGPITKQNVPVTRTAKDNPRVSNLLGMDLLKEYRCHFLFDENRVVVDEDIAEDRLEALTTDSKFHLYLPVAFENVTANAVWDTGAGITVADMTFVEKNPALFQPTDASTGTDSSGTQMETPMFMMTACMIGGHAFPPLKVAGVDLSQVNASIEIPMDLILGYNVLHRANWMFDFPNKRWGITAWLGD